MNFFQERFRIFFSDARLRLFRMFIFTSLIKNFDDKSAKKLWKMTSVSERIRKESWHACIAPTQRHGQC